MIRILPYDPHWRRMFETERLRLQDALGDVAVRIDHHGSTAVPGLSATPIIDIQISVARLQPMEPYARPLERLGYTHVPHEGDAFAPFFHRPTSWPHTHHVNVVEAGSADERKTVAFRDYLRSDPSAAREYESLKRELAERFGGGDEASREAYASAKKAFTDAIDVRAFYDGPYDEASRLTSGPSRLEFERTKEILALHLPPPPARVLDVGGAAGAYSLWLASLGYEVHLIDTSARLVAEARQRSAAAARPIASMRVGNACALEEARESADVVLMLGPLYHLTAAGDRATALSEAHRVLRFGGVVAAAGISRYASTFDGLAQNLALDPQFVAIRDQDLRDGQHRNPTNHPAYFTTAYFHTPDGLGEELAAAGFDERRVLGVEGPAWILPDFDERWADPAQRDVIVDAARLLEAQPSVIGASAHLLGLAWKK